MFNPYCNGFYHTVVQGDTLYALSRKYQVPLQMIMRANPYVDVYNLRIGSQLCIPLRRRPFPPGGSNPGIPGFPQRPQMEPGPVVTPDAQMEPGPVVTPDSQMEPGPVITPDSQMEPGPVIMPRMSENYPNLEMEMAPSQDEPDSVATAVNTEHEKTIGPGMRGVPVAAHLVEPGESMMDLLSKTGLKLYEFVELNPLEGIYLKEGSTYYTAKE